MKNAQPMSMLFTDLYELTMAQAYWQEGFNQIATFELSFRTLPSTRNYALATGLSDVIDYLENLHATRDDIDFLRQSGMFSEPFLDHLKSLRFSGDVYAVLEGTPIFPHEPIVQVVAPIIEAQLVETFIINQIHLQTVIASKAARIMHAAQDRTAVDFGSRRAHGTDAALKAAKACYMVGFQGTSNVLAGRLYGIPTFGTMAHSYIQAHGNEVDAFQAFAHLYPGTTLLVDTYDTIEGIQKIVRMSREWNSGFPVRAVRLDSGDLLQLSRQSRALLDAAGLHHISILASGDLDEYRIKELLDAGAPINAFGVGTKAVVATDGPVLDMVYKLVEYAGVSRTKLSPGKVLYPGRKQVFRTDSGSDGYQDTLGLFHEDLSGKRLLQAAMIGGRRTTLICDDPGQIRTRVRAELARLPPGLHSLGTATPPFAVALSEGVARELERLRPKV